MWPKICRAAARVDARPDPRWCDGLIQLDVRRKDTSRGSIVQPHGRRTVRYISQVDALLQDPGLAIAQANLRHRESHEGAVLAGSCLATMISNGVLIQAGRASYPEKTVFGSSRSRAGLPPHSGKGKPKDPASPDRRAVLYSRKDPSHSKWFLERSHATRHPTWILSGQTGS